MARLYVTDMIGEEYLTWQNKDQIILATPTGSGKTTFVVSRLLKHAVSMGKHVVYYCNRRVLRDQFEIQSQNLISQVFGSDLGLAEDAVKHLHIFTYQGAEDAGNYPHIHFLVEEAHDEVTTFQKQENGMQVQLRAHIADKYERVAPSEIMYYIFDEAHYFLSDSLIRHQGNFWADHDLDHSISVFLTATPKPLHLFLSMRRSLPFDHDFTSVYSARAQRTTLENQYDDIEWCITNILESWKVQDKVSFKLKCSPERKAAFMRRWHDPLRRYFWHIEQALKKAEEQPHYYRTEPDYLKHQLTWIGKEYDPTCWLDGSNKRTELIALLDIVCESRPLRQGGAYHEQSDFAEQCKDLMLALPTPPKELKRNRSRYKDGKSPGINLLNKYLQELGLPYEIDGSKRELFDGVDKKKTVWTVKYKHAEESSADNHTSTE